MFLKNIRPFDIKPIETRKSIFTKKLLISIESLELGTPILDSPN